MNENDDIVTAFSSNNSDLYISSFQLNIPSRYIKIVNGQYESIFSYTTMELENFMEEFKTNADETFMIYIYAIVEYQLDDIDPNDIASFDSDIDRILMDSATAIIDINHQLYDCSDSATDMGSTINVFKTWFIQFYKDRINDVKIGEMAETSQKELTSAYETSGLDISGNEISRQFYVSKITWNDRIRDYSLPKSWEGKDISLIMGIDIFNMIEISSSTPYVGLNIGDGDEQRHLYKIYNSGSINNIIPDDRLDKEKDTLFITIYYQQRYIIFMVDFDLSAIIFNVDDSYGIEIHMIIDRLSKLIPFFNFGPATISKIIGRFAIYNIEYHSRYFLQMLQLDPTFSSFLYTEESTKPSFEKKKDVIRYHRMLADVDRPRKIVMTTYEGIELESANTATEKFKNYLGRFIIHPHVYRKGDHLIENSPTDIENGTYYIIIDFTVKGNMHELRDFNDLMLTLFTLYDRQFEDVEAIYSPYTFVTSGIDKFEGGKVEKRSRGLMSDNSKKAPDLFVVGYASICQGDAQPIIIDDSDVIKWTSEPISETNHEHRQIIEYQYHNQTLKVGCPSQRKPYPGLTENKRLDNRSQFPYIPCCFVEDQTKKKSSIYSKIMHHETIERKGRAEITTGKILRRGQYGKLPVGIELMMQKMDQDNESMKYNDSVKYYRYGISPGKNSFLACVLYAIDSNNEMFDSKLPENKFEDRLYKKRIELLDHNIGHEVLFQEMYDYSQEEINDEINSKELALDPNKFYHLLEEIYDVNIYILSSNTVLDDTVIAQDYGFFEIPRHSYYHVRPYKNRSAIMILYNTGSARSPSPYPICELIIRRTTEGDYLMVDETANRKLFQYFVETNRVLIDDKQYIPFDWEFPITDAKLVTQCIDDCGKLKAIQDENNIIYWTSPAQPLNLPLMNIKNIYNTVDPYKIAGTIIGTVSDGTRIQFVEYIENEEILSDEFTNNRTYWVKIDENMANKIEKDHKIMALPTSTNIIFPSKIPDELSIDSLFSTSVIVDRIIQLFKLLFTAFYINEVNNTLSKTEIANIFMEKYVMIEKSKYQTPDITTMSRYTMYVDGDTAYDLINKHNEYVPNLFKNGMMIFNDIIYQKLKQFLNVYIDWLDGAPIFIPPTFNGFMTKIDDFSINNNDGFSKLFLDIDSRNDWIKSISSNLSVSKHKCIISDQTQLNVKIYHTLTEKLENNSELFIIEIPITDKTITGSNYYIIYNIPYIQKSQRSVAIAITKIWNDKRIIDINVEGHVFDINIIEYSLNRERQFEFEKIPTSTLENSGDSYLPILKYAHDKYAAMMKI